MSKKGEYLPIKMFMFVIVFIAAVSFGIRALWEKEITTNTIRATNGGVVPGKEAIDTNGTIYQVYVITHEGNIYTCFSRDYRSLGCAKE